MVTGVKQNLTFASSFLRFFLAAVRTYVTPAINFLFLFFLLTSCSTPNWWKPYGYTIFKKVPKDGSPGFQLGWIHGCQSGLGSQFGGGIYMYFYTWSRDPDIVSSSPDIDKIRRRYKKELAGVNWNNMADIKKNFSDYNTIFWPAHSFCHGAVLGILQTTDISGDAGKGMIPTISGNERYDPSQESFGRVWSLHGKGDTRWGTGLW
ncbi:MAG: hypothetical protein FJX34_01035 [Alphaproteobacteria bacterium]|nr:hypothetical protein [Alphaproteobacteria bacterium]